jgi:hypothetical protein
MSGVNGVVPPFTSPFNVDRHGFLVLAKEAAEIS